jgi:exportin-1
MCEIALLKLDSRQFKFVIDSCMWASKHDNREVEYAGLNMCLELITNVADAGPEISNGFFQQFFIPILQDIFFVLTDTDHKAGFKSQSNLLSRMFYLVHPADGTLPKIQGPISPDQAATGLENKDFLGQFVGNLLQTAFPNLQPCVESNTPHIVESHAANAYIRIQIKAFVDGLFTMNNNSDRFKLNLRDFLIQLKEFAGDNAELYAEEKELQETAARAAERERLSKVSGLLKPAELDDEL